MVIFYALLEVFAAALVLLPVFIILNITLFRNIRKSTICFLFSLYLAAVYYFAGLPNITYIRFELSLCLLPIVGFFNDLKNSLLNILLFVPLGMILPLVWEKYRNRNRTLLFGFATSLFIELLQIFTFRATDINDLITNTLGTFFGFVLGEVLVKKVPATKQFSHDTKVSELYLVCALTFAVMFLAQPFIHTVLWNFVMH